MTHLATRILVDHTLTIERAADEIGAQSPHTSYGFGTTLLAMPFDIVQRAFHPAGQGILTLANPIVLALCGVVLFFIGRRLGWRRWVCAATALGFGVLTTALSQSTEFFSEPGVTFMALLIVLGALIWNDRPNRGALCVGVGVAGSILFRPDSLVLI